MVVGFPVSFSLSSFNCWIAGVDVGAVVVSVIAIAASTTTTPTKPDDVNEDDASFSPWQIIAATVVGLVALAVYFCRGTERTGAAEQAAAPPRESYDFFIADS